MSYRNTLSWGVCMDQIYLTRNPADGKPMMNNTRLYAYDKEGRLLQATNKMPGIGYRTKPIVWTTRFDYDPKKRKPVVAQAEGTEEGKGAEIHYFGLKHHGSTILTVYEDGSMGYPEGVYSRTTMMRVNTYGKYGIYSGHDGYEIFLPSHQEGKKTIPYPFKWGMKIDAHGMPEEAWDTLHNPDVAEIMPTSYVHTNSVLCLGTSTGIAWRHWAFDTEQGLHIAEQGDCPCDD